MAPLDLEIWLNHFEHHGRYPRGLAAAASSRLRPEDRRRVAGSMAIFQRGERSWGLTLLKAAEPYARSRGIPALARILELLLREEQRHAALLLAYLMENQIAPARTAWTDRGLRRLRRLAGLEFNLYLLIGAAMNGIVYYRALEKAARCPRLIALCRGNGADKLAHVGFLSELLLSLRAQRPPALQALMRLTHRVVIVGHALVVWLRHRKVLRRAGYGALGFLRACLSQYGFYLEPIPRRTASPSLSATRGAR